MDQIYTLTSGELAHTIGLVIHELKKRNVDLQELEHKDIEGLSMVMAFDKFKHYQIKRGN